ncbi:hypothetical protein MSIBF_A500001 [groundwater metagenome]|uniref:Uncharacterized protein n=1 Tax=groundwater metagenome TaxID=717931 RepID=A0A098EE72_9ZZZZ
MIIYTKYKWLTSICYSTGKKYPRKYPKSIQMNENIANALTFEDICALHSLTLILASKARNRT